MTDRESPEHTSQRQDGDPNKLRSYIREHWPALLIGVLGTIVSGVVVALVAAALTNDEGATVASDSQNGAVTASPPDPPQQLENADDLELLIRSGSYWQSPPNIDRNAVEVAMELPDPGTEDVVAIDDNGLPRVVTVDQLASTAASFMGNQPFFLVGRVASTSLPFTSYTYSDLVTVSDAARRFKVRGVASSVYSRAAAYGRVQVLAAGFEPKDKPTAFVVFLDSPSEVDSISPGFIRAAAKGFRIRDVGPASDSAGGLFP
jgi:hypothetical protein